MSLTKQRVAGYCQTIRQGSPLLDSASFRYPAERSVSIIPGEIRMTISFKLFGFAVCFSITKVITLPYERLGTRYQTNN